MTTENKNDEHTLSAQIIELIDDMDDTGELSDNEPSDQDQSYYFSDSTDEQNHTKAEAPDTRSEQAQEKHDIPDVADKGKNTLNNPKSQTENIEIKPDTGTPKPHEKIPDTQDSHFSEIFDNIKEQQHKEKDIARKKRAKRIKKINESRTKEVTQKLQNASEIDDNLIFNNKTQKLEHVNADEDSDTTPNGIKPHNKTKIKTKQHRYVFTNIINEQYESIVKIPASTFIPKDNPCDDYKVNLRYNPIKLLLAEVADDEKLKKEIEDENKERKSVSKKNQWDRLENAFFEESQEYTDEEKVSTSEINEYLSRDDAPHIEGMLFKSKYRLFFQTISLFVLFLISFVFVCIRRFSSAQDGIGNTVFYICTQFVPLIVASVIAKDTITNGIRGFIRLKGNSDSTISFAVIVAVIYSFVSIFQVQQFSDAGYHLYNVIPLLALFTNSLGKFDIVKRIFMNFKFIKVSDDKYSVKLCDDKNLDDDIQKNSAEKNDSYIAYQKGISFYSDFLKHSYRPDISEILSGKAAIVSIICSLAVLIFSIFKKYSLLSSLASLSAVSSSFIPIFAMLLINMPLLKLCQKYIKKGVMIASYYSVNLLAKSKCMVFKASDLYYGNAISLHGVKMQNDNYPSEKLMLELASIFKATSSNLYSPFLKIISGREHALLQVSQCEYLDNKGIVAYINNKRFLVGNRNLLVKYSVKPPSQAVEEKYTQKNRFITYVAVGTQLCCLLLLDYRPQPATVDALQSLEDNNIKILITTSDPNINAKMISSQFKVYYSSVKVLKSKTARFFENAFSDNNMVETEGCAVTKGSSIHAAQAISSSIKMKNNINISVIVQMLLIVILACLVIIMNIRFGATAINAFEFICCDAFCVLVVFILSHVRKL